MDKKSPYIAAVLNFLTLGGGYIYFGRRTAFGAFLIVAAVIMAIEYFAGTHNFLEHINSWQNIVDTHTISMTLIAIALAYDGYVLAKGKM